MSEPTPKSEPRLSLLKDADALREVVRAYRYTSPDLSLLERLYLERWWNFCASCYPSWLAPNLVTLSGGTCQLIALILTLLHSPYMQGESPGWIYAVDALLLFVYQTLDGSDGKHARNTRSGSPLGEVLDHGVDAWVLLPIALCSIDCFAFGLDSPWPWLTFFGAQLAFATSNLTLVASGRLSIGDMDVMELQTGMIITMLITAWYGTGIWSAEVPSLSAVWGSTVTVRAMVAAAANCGTVFKVTVELLEVWRAKGPLAPAARWQAATVAVHLMIGCVAYFRLVAAGASHFELLLLLLTTASAFAEWMMRVLVLRIGHVRPKLLPHGSLCVLAFCFAAGHGTALYTAILVVAIALHLRFFVLAVRALAAALDIHPFILKAAKAE